MISNIVGKDIKLKLPVAGAIEPIETVNNIWENSVGTNRLVVYSDAAQGLDIMLFAFFQQLDFNTGELFMSARESDMDGWNMWELVIPATVLSQRGTWAVSVEIRQQVEYEVVLEDVTEVKTGYKRLAHGCVNFTVKRSVVSGTPYTESEVYTPSKDTQYENVLIVLNDINITKQDKYDPELETGDQTVVGAINELKGKSDTLDADKQDKSDPALNGLGDDNVVQAILASKQAADDAQGDADLALSTAESAAETANAAKQTAEAIDGKATEAQQNAAEAQQDAADALEQVVGKYTKPETGIPKTDLAADVQTSLGKADTAVQTESDPTVPGWAKTEDKPEYTAAEIAGLESITNLVNYYKKSETYTQTEVNNLISAIPKLAITVVTELPTVGDPTKIYVVGNKEYLWLADEERYEQFGDLSVDLSGYYDKDEVDALLAGKVDKVAGKGLSENDYTTDEKDKLTGIATGAQVNVKSDWNAVSGDAEILNKPTIPAEQVNADWNAVSGKAQILNKPVIPSAYTLPTASDIVKGGIKVGAGLQMDGEVLSATGVGTNINVEVLGDWS